MHAVRLITARLTIAACPLDIARSLIKDRRGLKEIFGARLPPDWPSPELAEVLPLYVQELLHDPTTLGWGIWIALNTEQNVVVGDAGFKGHPDKDGTVEIGYGVAPVHQGRGYATEAVQALIVWAFAHTEVRRIIAECAPDNTASIRVLTKLGFRTLPRGTDALRWELPRTTEFNAHPRSQRR